MPAVLKLFKLDPKSGISQKLTAQALRNQALLKKRQLKISLFLFAISQQMSQILREDRCQ